MSLKKCDAGLLACDAVEHTYFIDLSTGWKSVLLEMRINRYSAVQKFPDFMKPEISLPCLIEPAT
jgi:hypothetical protein